MTSSFTEEKRQAVHIALIILAFSLKYLNRLQAAVLLLGLFFITLIIIPKLRVRSIFYRHSENKYSQGAVLYFLVLFIIVLIFPLWIAAISWAIMALGDGAATLIGRKFKCRELPWNKKKSYAGSIAFVVFGFAGATLMLKWMLPELMMADCAQAAVKTTLIAAVVESLPTKINDNVSVPIASALVLYFLSLA